MTRSHLPLKWMKNFKAVAIDYEFYLTLSDKPVSVCMTERQMYVLSVQNTYTAWLTRWYNTDDITQSVVVAIASEIEALLMCGCGVPAPSFTDYINSITYNTATSATYQTTYNTWEAAGNTIASIAPDLDLDTGDILDISRVLCLTLKLLMKTVTVSAQQTQQGTLNEAADLTRGLTTVFGGLATAASAGSVLAGGGVAILGFFSSPWLAFGLALAAVGTGIASLIMGTQQAAFADEGVIAEVLCTLQTNTEGKNMTRDVFINALTPNSLSGAAAELAAVVQKFLDDETTYLQFMVSAQGIYESANLSVLPDCECVQAFCDGGTEKDFRASMSGWTIANARGTWVSGSGVRRADASPVYIALDKAGNFTVSKVKVATTSDDMGTVTVFRRNSSTSVSMGSSSTGVPQMGGGFVYTVNTPGWNLSGSLGLTIQFQKATNIANTIFVQEVCYDS